MTTADGRFTFVIETVGIEADFRVTATKPGYLSGAAGNLGPLDYVGQVYHVAAARPADDVVVRLWPAATLAGRVTDTAGEGAIGARVELYSAVYTGLGLRWIRSAGQLAKTDDRGEYRLEGLKPGDYVLSVRRATASDSDAATFFPSGVSAATVHVFSFAAGDSARADVVLTRKGALGSVTGTIRGGDVDLATLVVEMVALDAAGRALDFSRMKAPVGPSGTFAFREVPDGQYVVSTVRFPEPPKPSFLWEGDFLRTASSYLPAGTVLAPLPPDPTWVARTTASVDPVRRHDHVELDLQPGSRIGGRVVFEGGEISRNILPTLPLVVRPADGTDLGKIPQSRIEGDGTFTSVGLPDGDYIVNLAPNAEVLKSWRVVSITLDERQVLGEAIELRSSEVGGLVLTLSQEITAISGTVVDTAGRVPKAARVIVFPTSRSKRSAYLAPPAPQLVLQAPVMLDGTYRVEVPPGAYHVAAVSAFPSTWMTPAYLETLESRAASLDVRRGEQEVARLVIR
jgi:hypothetical protein